MSKFKVFFITSLFLGMSLAVRPGNVSAAYCTGAIAGYINTCSAPQPPPPTSNWFCQSPWTTWCPSVNCGAFGTQTDCQNAQGSLCGGWGSCLWCSGVYGNCTAWGACSSACGPGTQTRTCYDTYCGLPQTQTQNCTGTQTTVNVTGNISISPSQQVNVCASSGVCQATSTSYSLSLPVTGPSQFVYSQNLPNYSLSPNPTYVAISSCTANPGSVNFTYTSGPACSPPSGLSNWWKMENTSDSVGTANGTGTTISTPTCVFQNNSPTNNNLISYWKMDETSGNTVADMVSANNGTTSSTNVCSFPNNNPTTPGPVSYWKMDETSGANVTDTMGNYNGTATGTTSPIGKIGYSRGFNGSSDYINVSASAGNFGTNNFTIAGWIKSSSATTPQYIISKRNYCSHDNFFNMGIGSGKLFAEVDQDTSGTNYIGFGGNKVINDGQWHHIAMVRSGTNLATYVDGVTDASGNSAGVANINSSYPLQFSNSPCANKLNGQTDEFGVWNRALSANEILALYNGSGSGAGETITCSPTYPAVVSGKINNARSFNGSSDYIDTNSTFSSLTNNFSVSLWVNPAGAQTAYADIFGNHNGGGGTNGIVFQQNNTTTNQYYFAYGNGSAWVFSNTVQLTAGVWQHIVVTKDLSNCLVYVNGIPNATATCNTAVAPSPMNLRLGQGYYYGGRFFNGSVDEVGVWNRTLSAAEVSALYNSAAGNQCFFVSPSAPTTVTGKINNAQNFVWGQYINIPNNVSVNKGTIKTVGAFVKTSPTSGNQTIFNTWDGTNGYILYVNPAGKAVISNGTTTVTSTAIVADGTWHYVAGVWNGTTGYIYTDTNPAVFAAITINESSSNSEVGARCALSYNCTDLFVGAIDELRLYNRVLSASEISQEAQPAAGVTCGPCGGTIVCGVGTQSCSGIDTYCTYSTTTTQSCIVPGTSGATFTGTIMNTPVAPASPTVSAVKVCATDINTGTGSFGKICTGDSGQQTSQAFTYKLVLPGPATYSFAIDPTSIPSPYVVKPDNNPQLGTTCGATTIGPTFWYLSDAGIVSGNTLNAGAGNGFSQAGAQVPPGYNLKNYTNLAPLTNLSYDYFSSTILKNARSGNPLNATELTSAPNCPLGNGIAMTTTNASLGKSFDFYCYTGTAGNFDSQFTTAVTSASTNIKVLYPYQVTGLVTITTAKTFTADNDRIIALIPGSLQVNANVSVPTTLNNSGAVFILKSSPPSANGDLLAVAAVTQLDGFYIFPGIFDDDSDNGPSGTALFGNGSLINTGTTPWTFNRSVAATTGNPAEKWTYQPKYLVIFNDILSSAKYSWQELPPQ